MPIKVTVNNYKKDKYYPSVVRAVARILARSDVVAPVQVLLEIGNLSKKNYEAWKAGRVAYLERVFEGNLSKANRILRIIGFHVHDLDMVPGRATYRATSGRHVPLRFSKSGLKAVEDAYSTQYRWNKSPEKKRQAIEEAERQRATAVHVGTTVAPQTGSASGNLPGGIAVSSVAQTHGSDSPKPNFPGAGHQTDAHQRFPPGRGLRQPSAAFQSGSEGVAHVG